jgi:alpha-1,2-mannosyltransferase
VAVTNSEPATGHLSRERVKRTRRQVAVVLVFGAAVWAFLAVAAVRHGYFDLNVYYGAVRYWTAGHDIYDYLRPSTEYGFTYPPFAALVMLPMALLTWRETILVSLTLSVLATGLVLYWLVDPIARRQGWTRWFALAIAAGFAAAYEPMRETINFGQVNMVLVVLVLADLLLLVVPGRRLAGVGIGLAVAVKLTPGVFVLYLLLTRRFRAAGVAVLTAVAATLAAAAVTPDESRVFWTDAVWNVDRIGSASFVSNQSLSGVVARLGLDPPWSSLLLAALVGGAFAVWVRRARAAWAAGDEMTGFTLTAIFGCLASPFTWVHHLVWVMPAFPLLVDTALAPSTGRRRGRRLLVAAGVGYAVLCSRLVWPFDGNRTVWGELGSDAYALICVILLVALPVRERAGRPASAGAEGVAHGRDVEPVTDGVRADGAVGDEPVPQVEPAGPLVPVKRP